MDIVNIAGIPTNIGVTVRATKSPFSALEGRQFSNIEDLARAAKPIQLEMPSAEDLNFMGIRTKHDLTSLFIVGSELNGYGLAGKIGVDSYSGNLAVLELQR